MTNKNELLSTLSACIAEAVDAFLPLVHDDAPDANNGITEAVLHCQTSFNEGVFGAGLNLLRIITIVLANYLIDNPEALQPMKDKLESCIEVLEDMGCPEGAYFRAYCLIYNLLDTGLSSEDNLAQGFSLMDKLADEGNVYALKFEDFLEDLVMDFLVGLFKQHGLVQEP